MSDNPAKGMTIRPSKFAIGAGMWEIDPCSIKLIWLEVLVTHMIPGRQFPLGDPQQARSVYEGDSSSVSDRL